MNTERIEEMIGRLTVAVANIEHAYELSDDEMRKYPLADARRVEERLDEILNFLAANSYLND